MTDTTITPAQAAAALGRLGGRIGGRSKSKRKRAASRANGKKGGRPRKAKTPPDPPVQTPP